METCSDLEVDVNGEESIFLDKNIICAYSGKFRKLLGKSNCCERNLKVIFNDFPGGAVSFELVSRFCYNNGRISVTPSNTVLLHRAAEFMEVPMLLELTEKSMEEIQYWTGPELITALKQCQDLDTSTEFDFLARRFVDSLVGKMNLSVEASPSSVSACCSSHSSMFRLSCDSKSTESFKNCSSRSISVIWWFDELLILCSDLFEALVKLMVSQKLDHFIITKFLLYYQKAKFSSVCPDEKRKILETTIDCLYVLDRSCVSIKSLFGILRLALRWNVSKNNMDKLEKMIGYQLDQATLDNLLVPSPPRSNHLYDVNLILRFAKAFLDSLTTGGIQLQTPRLNRTASLIDQYIAEVAPDPCLKPSKFLALVTALPVSARESHDEIHRAIDMYLEAHVGLTEGKKHKIAGALSYEKVSGESSSRYLIPQNSKLRRVVTDDKNGEKEKLKEHLQGIQWRVMELERACRKMESQMERMKKGWRSKSRGNTRSLPKLCS